MPRRSAPMSSRWVAKLWRSACGRTWRCVPQMRAYRARRRARLRVSWQIVPAVMDEMMSDKDPVRSKRVTDAMLKMVKLDIAKLQAAYDGKS